VPRRSGLILSAIFMAALVARLSWTLWTAPVPPLLSDPEYYHATALSLARGEGYSVVFDAESGFAPGGDATAFWPPGYSVFLGSMHWVFGESLAVARLANAVVGALAVIPVYFIGRRLFGDFVGLVGAAIAAPLPSLVFWTPVLFADTLFTLLFASALAFVLYGLRSDGTFNPAAIVAAGVLVAMATLIRGQALILITLAPVWWVLEGSRVRGALRWAAVALAPTLVVLGAWTVRNVVAIESPIVLSANFGYNLRVGHAPYSTGRYILPHDLWSAPPGTTFQEREMSFNDRGTRRAIDYALGNPKSELELTGRKIVGLWRPDSDVLSWVSTFGETPLPARAWEPLRLLLDSSYLAVLALAGAWVVRFGARQPRPAWVAVSLVALWTAVHVVFFGEPRYHLPLLVVLVPTAAAFLAEVTRYALRGRRGLHDGRP